MPKSTMWTVIEGIRIDVVLCVPNVGVNVGQLRKGNHKRDSGKGYLEFQRGRRG